MTKGNLMGKATVETDAGTFTFALGFTDYDMPDHRDTRGYAIPRYSLRIEAPEGTESFTVWGSIHEAEEQEPGLNTDVLNSAESVINDSRAFYELADGTHDDLGRSLTGKAIQEDLAPMIDNLAEEWQIESPSEAVRTFGAVMDTAEKFKKIGVDYHASVELYREVREELESR